METLPILVINIVEYNREIKLIMWLKINELYWIEFILF